MMRDLLQRAARAPSGGNLQPWHIHLVTGGRLVELKGLMRDRVAQCPKGEGAEYAIYPPDMAPLYRDRTFQIGEALYGRLEIDRSDKAARAKWFERNFDFFGAPVGLFCCVDRGHGPPQWSDLGMYLQTLMLLLRERGLDSCPQECWALYPATIGRFLDLPDEHMLFTGMAIGWMDPAEPANDFRSPRASLDEFVHFHS